MKKKLLAIVLVFMFLVCTACNAKNNSSTINSGNKSSMFSESALGTSSEETTASKDDVPSNSTHIVSGNTNSKTESQEEVLIDKNSNTNINQPDVWDKYKEGVIKVENYTGKNKGDLLVFNKADMYGDKSINVIGASITHGQNAVKLYQSYIAIFKNTLN